MTNLAFQDDLCCPDCGAPAARIGYEYAHNDGTIGWQDTPVHMTRKRSGGKFEPGQQGVTQIEAGEKATMVRGQEVREPVTRWVLLVTHCCTDNACAVAFPRHLGTHDTGRSR